MSYYAACKAMSIFHRAPHIIQPIVQLIYCVTRFTVISSLFTLTFNLTFIFVRHFTLFLPLISPLPLYFLLHIYVHLPSNSSCPSMHLTSLSQQPPPDVFSLCIQPLPMKPYAPCAIYLFPIPAQLTSLPQWPSTCLSTTHHYNTAHARHRLSCFYLPQYHTYFHMLTLLPHHEALP